MCCASTWTVGDTLQTGALEHVGASFVSVGARCYSPLLSLDCLLPLFLLHCPGAICLGGKRASVTPAQVTLMLEASVPRAFLAAFFSE